jgi:signal peptidase I
LGIVFTLLVLGIIRSSTPVVGNSMNPTIHDKENVNLSSFTILNKLFFKPQKGDIVTFESGRTSNTDGQIVSYIKRIVAVGGDEVSIRDGFLYVNNELVKEPYTAKPRSTFGGSFLADCKTIKIPDGYYFALGDNRKRSKDSRDVGLVSIKEIESILPMKKQDQFKDRLRDASNDGVDHGLPLLIWMITIRG